VEGLSHRGDTGDVSCQLHRYREGSRLHEKISETVRKKSGEHVEESGGAGRAVQKCSSWYGVRQWWHQLVFGLAMTASNNKLCLRAGSGSEGRKKRGKKREGSVGPREAKWVVQKGRKRPEACAGEIIRLS
jgi:hypothetical protein